MDYYCERNPRIPMTVHVVRIDRSRADLALYTTLGGRTQIGMATLSEQARSIPSSVGKPVAALNGDYYCDDPPFVGDPDNLQVLHGGELVSAPKLDRAFLYLDAHGEPHITNATSTFTVTWPNGQSMPIGLNECPRRARKAVLYTSAVGSSTRFQGMELVLARSGGVSWPPLRIGQTLTARIQSANPKGCSKITPECMILSMPRSVLSQCPPLAPGMDVKISTATVPDLSGATLAIGGGPTLVRGGKVRDLGTTYGFKMRNPRSAMGWNSQYYYFVQADGRQPSYSMGMTLVELADYFVKLKCDYAVNLDGGGSCATWLGGKIVNKPSEGVERPSANALVLVRRPSR